MSPVEVIARHFSSGTPLRLRWKDGVISAVEPVAEAPAELWVAPRLMDLQINGYGGIDFQQDNLSLDDLLSATRQLRSAGCGSYLLTLITDAWPKMMARLCHLRELRQRSADLQHAIAGWHIEGPFLSSEPGFCGAHDPALMRDPKPEHIRELRRVAEDDPMLLTLAPERAGAIEAISLAVSLGIKVSLGHSNASVGRLAEAVKAGATGFTHLGNGCPRTLDRHDNILWRVFETAGLTISLIPDGTHVSPSLFRLVHRLAGPGGIYYTTDAMSAAGAPPGTHRLGRLELEVGEDRVVRLPGTPNFAGSALRPIDGVFRAAGMLGVTWNEVWARFSTAPARFMGLAGAGVSVGEAATFCVIQAPPRGALVSLQTFVRGVQNNP